MAQAYIVEALRTAGGRRGGALRDWHPADLGAAVLDALVERSGIDPAAIEDVIAGCVGQIGEQSFHIGRNMVMASLATNLMRSHLEAIAKQRQPRTTAYSSGRFWRSTASTRKAIPDGMTGTRESARTQAPKDLLS